MTCWLRTQAWALYERCVNRGFIDGMGVHRVTGLPKTSAEIPLCPQRSWSFCFSWESVNFFSSFFLYSPSSMQVVHLSYSTHRNCSRTDGPAVQTGELCWHELCVSGRLAFHLVLSSLSSSFFHFPQPFLSVCT